MFGEYEKPPERHSAFNYIMAIAIHAVVILAFAYFAFWTPKDNEVVIPIELKVVVNENLDGAEDEPPPDTPPQPEVPPPEPDPPKPPDPPPPAPDPIVDNVEAVEIKPPDPKPPETKPPEPPKKDPPKIDPKKAAEEKKRREAERIERMRNSAKTIKDKPKPTSPPPRNNGRTENSPKDWKKYLNQGFTPSSVNSGLDASDNQRCIQLISKAFHDRWVSPAWTSELREILLSVQFGAGGKVLGYNIIQSSGDPSADRTVLKAASLVHAVRGLSSAFLENNKTVTVRFKVKPQ